MKFVISTQEFNNLMNRCFNVVPVKTTLPTLANFLIEAVGDEIVVTATDLIVAIRCSAKAKVLEAGSTTLPAKRLLQLTRELTAVNIEVTTTKDITDIVADSSRFKLHGMSTQEFPSMPEMSGAVEIQLPQKELKEKLFRTTFAVSREDNRYALTGLLMQVTSDMITFVGTDGKRLARSHMATSNSEAIGNYIIPLKAAEEMIKNLKDDDKPATLLLNSDKIALKTDDTVMVAKLLKGEYPDVTRVIPEKSQVVLTLHREELMSLLRQIALFIADSMHSVRFSFSQGELRLNANTSDIGEGKVSMPVNYHGQLLEIAFNPTFFLDILRHTNTETVNLGVTDSYNPGVITDPEAHQSAGSLFVLMPMRLNEE
ncbi:MAG: DNA polymerase III subunit beta [Parachlamydiaceae bacterium]|nr:DNA polymerase III subunit beta [Parachlamydiaceae bacterium]